jgi:hypothetical protein
MGAFGANGGVGAVPRKNDGVGGMHEEKVVDGVDDGVEVAAGKLGGSRATGEERWIPGCVRD